MSYFEKWALIQSDGMWAVRRFEYSSEKIIYIGRNVVHKAATAAIDWHIWKFSYTGDDVTMIEGPLRGDWDSRATLDWG
jgi:hypothetical protein